MNLARWLAAAILTMLGACTPRVLVPEIRLDTVEPRRAEAVKVDKPRVEIVEVPVPLPLPGQLKPLPKPAVSKSKAAETGSPTDQVSEANKAAKIEPSKAGYINAIQVYPYTNGALYQLYAAVNQVTDVALEVGEKLVSVSAGDTVRWVVGDTASGEGKSAQVHILVKPIAPDLTTNLVITTDRRTYHLELHATEKTYMASVSWTYPSAALLALKREPEASWVTTVDAEPDPAALRFRYRIEGDAPWKPQRVFDDGTKVYIQFPSGLKQGEAPPLFVIGGDGKPALVNYRVKGNTYVVDRLFAAAELRLGTATQQVVRIVRTDAVWKERQP
ncbi:MAG: P-type conjugative transfer protein TrbG [Hyphomicrobiales bacterium]|nr:P-type conjugative transfer protein TrbG [Hyphomicrobiales bacterium]